MSAKFSTTQGPEQKPVNGTIYVGSYAGDDQRVLWFKLHDRLYPSVYMLWRLPGMLPAVHTNPVVIKKLQTGADLMTPGLAMGPPFDSRTKKGTTITVADMGRPSVPLVVGTAEIDICELQEIQGAKGHAVRTLHWMGDELWAWSPNGKSGLDPPDRLEPPDLMRTKIDRDGDAEEMTGEVAAMRLEDEGEEQGGVSLDHTRGAKLEVDKAEVVDGDEKAKEEEFADQPEREMTTKEIDEAFRNAFLYGIHHYMMTNPTQQNYGLDLPLQQSWVLSNLVQPFLPAFTPQQSGQLQIKRTSFKNVKKFIRSLDKEQIVKSKERNGNEVVIFDIDFDDSAIREFKPYRLPKKETAASPSLGRGTKANEVADAGGDSSIGQSLKILTLYKPKEKLGPLFEASKSGTHELYTVSELGTITTSYIEAEKLIKENNKRLVSLNPFLANTIFGSDSAVDKEVMARGSCQRDTLNSRVIASCAPYYHVARNDDTKSTKPKAGAPPKISIALETRSGNKTVTKVSGLEPFFIPPQPLADELRKACAGSTSVERLHGSSPKNPVMEIMVQGPQRDAVVKALEKRGVDRKWVDVVDKTKGKKK